MSKLIVSCSPHISTPRTTQKIMLDVIIALLPAAVMSVVIFGIKSLFVIVTCVAAAMLSEFLFNLICKKEQTVSDLSSAVTGLLLALNIPSTIPLWQAAIGSVFAIVVVKCLFGGIGQNFANPAITARIFLLLSFSSTMTAAVFPVNNTDIVSGATPLGVLSGQEGTLPSYLDLFLGFNGGALGETCALALLIGGIYLIARGVITWHTPVVFIATVFLFSLVLGQDPVAEILTGGLFIGAFFMATDYATTPNTTWGKVIFGLGCGIITVLIRV
ncbi:MAG: RnfABCDGE type electron transport complex subunit D, partial [Oscillospiraceae bacterium]